VNAVTIPPLTITDFEAGRVDPEFFDHEAHVYVAWLYVRRFPLAEAISRFDGALRRLTDGLGVPGKYHATITWMFLVLIAERCHDGEDWPAFRARNADLVASGRTALGRYYTDTRLFSDLARRQFILPDRIDA